MKSIVSDDNKIRISVRKYSGGESIQLRHREMDLKKIPSKRKEPTDENIEYYKKQGVRAWNQVARKAIEKEKQSRCPLFKDFVPVALKHINSNVIKDTKKDRESRIEKYLIPFFGNKKLTKVTPLSIEEWQNHLLTVKGADMTKRTKQLLRAIFDRAIIHEHVKENPVTPTAKLREPRVEKRKIYTREEIGQMIDSRNGWVSLFVYTMVGLGLRSGEVVVIKFSDIDWSSKTITIQRNIRMGRISNTKTGVSRVVDIPVDLYNRLREKYEDKDRNKNIDWVFTTPKGDYYGDASAIVRRHLKPHTYATLSLQGGQNVNYVSKQLGHKDTRTTLEFYVKYLKDENDIKRADSILSF